MDRNQTCSSLGIDALKLPKAGLKVSGMKSCFQLLALAIVFTTSTLPAVADNAEKREQAERVVTEFWDRVWSAPADLRAIDELVVVDFELSSGGREIEGRDNLKTWVEAFQEKAKDVRL